MKHSSGSRQTANLSESIHQQLSMYTLAAGAAGVSVLALARPSEGKIIYTPANVVINDNLFSFDLNHDGNPDVTLYQGCFTYFPAHICQLGANPQAGNSIIVEGTLAGRPLVAALKAGANIGYAKHFAGHENNFYMKMAWKECGRGSCRTAGHWFYTQARYLGVKFQIKGKTHFGWMRLKNSSQNSATLTGFAYESIAGKSIKAGQTKGPADGSGEEDFGPAASLTNPIHDTPQPASLGMLALGAQGAPLWWRKESVGVAPE